MQTLGAEHSWDHASCCAHSELQEALAQTAPFQQDAADLLQLQPHQETFPGQFLTPQQVHKACTAAYTWDAWNLPLEQRPCIAVDKMSCKQLTALSARRRPHAPAAISRRALSETAERRGCAFPSSGRTILATMRDSTRRRSLPPPQSAAPSCSDVAMMWR